ncbi:MAG: response regulator [Gammaproteobacteria bacterium]|nr:MAG: response regulator [Gammaproteobacteria bacterium]
MRILLVEDDLILGDGIKAGLEQDGYVVEWAQDGVSAERFVSAMAFDAVVLDIGLPKQDGITTLMHMRKNNINTPVLLLTARDTVQDRITGLDSGADDYLIKPFDLDELCARLRALMRRHSGRASPEIRYRDIILDPASHTVMQNGKIVDITAREFFILQALLENSGRVLSRGQLEESLYSRDENPDSNTVEVHIHKLRKKLGKDIINTVRGVGYIVKKEERSRLDVS